jgi:DNA-binding response OmpR family regulator
MLDRRVTGERILLIEDDRRMRRAVALSLGQQGYEVIEAADGADGIRLLSERQPELVLLDVMLPGADGFEVCRQIRGESDVPIVFLTARTNTIDVVVGLESGADDYLTKPFDVHELAARIRAHLRRMRSRPAEHRVVIGELAIDPDAGEVTLGGTPVRLTKTEFELLRCLASKPNRVFTREVLLEQVWGYDYLGDSRLVDVHIRRLRAKVEHDPSSPDLIRTVRGYGYKLATAP